MSGSDSPTFFHGQPWSSWIERIGRDKPLSDDEPEAEPSSSVTRLSSDDIDLYGFCPERDTFYGVVCEICNAIIKPQALIQHMESRHASGTVNLPPPSTPIVKPTVKTPYCKVSKLKRTQSSGQIQSSGKTNHSGTTSSSTALSSSTASASASTSASSSSSPSIKRTAEQANLQNIGSLTSPRSPLETIAVQSSSNATTIVPSSPVKSPMNSGQPRRKRLKGDRGLLKDREYDADRHCGVWNDETGKPCTRSLTCKAHTVSLRRTVAGRSKAFDKLLAEHRAAKELPNRTSKVTLTGTVTVSTATNPTINVNSFLTANTNISAANESEVTPGSPPVLSLPDTYPLPKAVDLLYRCLAPHGSAKPTKLEEDFVNEELRLESALANSSIVNTGKSMMAPISVVLPSLSPITTNNETTSSVATLIPATVATAIPTIATTMSVSRTLPGNVLDTGSEAPIEIDPVESMTLYSPVSVYKDAKSQIVVQLPRGNNSLIQSPRNYQPQASMPSLSMFEPVEKSETPQQQQLQQQQQNQQQQQQHTKQMANGKRLNNSHSVLLSPLSRHSKRSKHEYRQEFSTSIQVEATTTSTPYPHFSDIAWSNCHPEPLAVSRWLRITSNRKQYNFNIH